MLARVLLVGPLLVLSLTACGVATAASPAPQPASASPSGQQPSASTSASSSPAPVFARSSLSIQAKSGSVPMQVEIADTEAKREYGLMNRTSLAPDAGMLFVFKPPAVASQEAFWMKDTLIPLSIAFVEPDLAIESVQDMAAMTQDLHYAPRDYAYAIEANLGFFRSHGVVAGDKVVLPPGV